MHLHVRLPLNFLEQETEIKLSLKDWFGIKPSCAASWTTSSEDAGFDVAESCRLWVGAQNSTSPASWGKYKRASRRRCPWRRCGIFETSTDKESDWPWHSSNRLHLRRQKSLVKVINELRDEFASLFLIADSNYLQLPNCWQQLEINYLTRMSRCGRWPSAAASASWCWWRGCAGRERATSRWRTTPRRPLRENKKISN